MKQRKGLQNALLIVLTPPAIYALHMLPESLAFYMIFLMAIGWMYGLAFGLYAAAVCCIITGFQDAGVYSIEQILLSCFFYLLTGSVSGYVRTRFHDSMLDIREEQELLEQKYTALEKAYGGALKKTKELQAEVLGFEDSYGKIYHMVMQLEYDKDNPTLYRKRAVQFMEEMLGDCRVAMFSPQGKLLMSSAFFKPGDLTTYEKLLKITAQHDFWKDSKQLQNLDADGFQPQAQNTETAVFQTHAKDTEAAAFQAHAQDTDTAAFQPQAQDTDSVLYAYGVFHKEIQQALIAIYAPEERRDFDVEQGAYYENKIQILCGLIGLFYPEETPAHQ